MDRGRQQDEQVNVIAHSINNNRFALLLFDQAAHEREQFLAYLRIDQWQMPLRAKDDVAQ